MMNNGFNPRFAVVIAHGKTEWRLVKEINRAFQFNIGIPNRVRKRNGSSIQVDGLVKYINKHSPLKNDRKAKKYCNPYPKYGKKWDGHIYALMDVGNVTRQNKNKYLRNQLSGIHSKFVRKHFIPIYDDPDIEHVLMQGGLKDIDRRNKKDDHYKKVFSQQLFNKPGQLTNFIKRIKSCRDTNLDIFLKDCRNRFYQRYGSVPKY